MHWNGERLQFGNREEAFTGIKRPWLGCHASSAVVIRSKALLRTVQRHIHMLLLPYCVKFLTECVVSIGSRTLC